jgi:hypothetical protein
MIGAEQLAEINQEQEALQLEVYPRHDGKPWIIEYEEAVEALREGRRRFLGEVTGSSSK